jgi:hypothetical protein
MAAATVHFRGPMLFITHDKYVRRVLIPDSGKEDTTFELKSHIAGFVIVSKDGKSEIDRGLISKGDIIVIDDKSGAMTADRGPTIDALISLQELANGGPINGDLKLRPDGDAFAVVKFNGGELRTRKGSHHVYQFPAFNPAVHPRPAAVPLVVQWDSKAAAVELTIGASKPWTLANEERVYIVNFEAFDVALKRPKIDELELGQGLCKAGLNEDTDFRWTFMLTTPENGMTLEEWLEGRELPTPFFDCSESEATMSKQLPTRPSILVKHGDGPMPDPGSGDCFDGRWEENP